MLYRKRTIKFKTTAAIPRIVIKIAKILLLFFIYHYHHLKTLPDPQIVDKPPITNDVIVKLTGSVTK